MLLTGIGLVVGALYNTIDRVKHSCCGAYSRLTDSEALMMYIMIIVGSISICYVLITRFGKGYLNKSELKRIKKENGILRLNIEQAKLSNELTNH